MSRIGMRLVSPGYLESRARVLPGAAGGPSSTWTSPTPQLPGQDGGEPAPFHAELGARFMTLVDAHVHIYPHVSIGAVLDIACRNFLNLDQDRGAWAGALFLADPVGVHVGERLREAVAAAGWAREGGWQLEPTKEHRSLIARRGSDTIAVALGQQLVTAESLEVLAIGANAELENGQTLSATIEAVREAQGMGIVPWGAGKWVGARGKLLERVMREVSDEALCLGDNGGRPRVWGVPQFELAAELGIPILRGSDPLPVTGDERRIGSFGFGLCETLSLETPFASLTNLIRGGAEVAALGKPVGLARAIFNQVRLRVAPLQGRA